MAGEKSNLSRFKDEALVQLVTRFTQEYSNMSTPEGLAQMIMGNPFDNAIPRTLAMLTKGQNLIAKEFGSKKAVEKDARMRKAGETQQLDPELFEELMRAQVVNDPYKQVEILEKYKQYFPESDIAKAIMDMQGKDPVMYDNMSYVGNQMEENSGVTVEALISQNQELIERIAMLEEQLMAYTEREGIQVSQNNMDFVQQAQTQARAGEEKDDKSRAIYEQDGISIEVAESLQPEKEQELQHGQEFSEAEQEVTQEDLEIAEKEVKERDTITEDGTVSIVIGNSKKITISVEPYITGDKETQMAQEANEQEQMASREENTASTEMTDDTSRE